MCACVCAKERGPKIKMEKESFSRDTTLIFINTDTTRTHICDVYIFLD